MRCVGSCIESLERRTLLNAAIEVWAGNADPSGFSADAGLNIDQSGYTRIGQSNVANTSVPFTTAANYKYFVIATRGRVQIDSIRNSSGTYVSLIASSANVSAINNATGASNNVYATVGTQTASDFTFAGYMLVVAPTTWTGITVKTGTVEPMFQFRVDLDASYMQGASVPYGYNAELQVQDNGLITSARVHTPAGRWFTVSGKHEGEDNGGELQWEKFYTTKAQMDAEVGDGVYTVYMETLVGAKSYSFTATGLSFPTQIPSTSSLTHGKTDTPTSLSISLPAITDSSVNSISMWISNSNEDEVYSSYFQPGHGSLDAVNLAPADSYWAELRFSNNRWTNPSGNSFTYEKTNEIGIVFATTGFTQGTSDLQGNSFTAATATLNPGDDFMLSLSVSSGGGIVVGSGAGAKQPLTHIMGLSTNKIIGDADDVILFTPVDVGEMANWQFAGDMGVRIPDKTLPGSYFVFGFVDSQNVAIESNEANNIGWSSTAVITIPAQAILLDPVTHNLNVMGTAGADTITVQLDSQTVHATLNGATRSFARSEVTGIYVNGDAGNDSITLTGALPGALLYGGAGNDTIKGASGNDKIYGNDGDDRIFGYDGLDSVYGGLGADSIDGGGKDDSLIGGDSSDTILGGLGNDYIEGKGKADTLYGGAGNDTILGGAGSNNIYGDDGDDRIYALNLTGFCDTISGGAGTDGAQRDSNDVLTSIEQNLLV